jgi:hypothetical protein
MHTSLHDVEALYWMLWWTISYRSFAEGGPPKPWQPQLYNDIFNDNKKMDYLTNENTIGWWWIYDIKGSFKEIFWIYPYLVDIAECFVEGYKTLECTYPGKLNHLAYADNHVPEKIVAIFSELLVASEKRLEIYLFGRILLDTAGGVEKRAPRNYSHEDVQAAGQEIERASTSR